MTKIEELEQKLNEMNEGLEVGIKKFQEQITDFNNELRIAKEDFLDELNECQKALAELKESKKEGKWKPALGKLYWYRGDEGINIFDTWENDEIDEWRRENLKIFETEEECERYWRFMDTVKEKGYEFSDLEWRNDDIKKWVIQYDYMINQLVVVEHLYIKQFGMVYFKNEDDAKYIIDNFKEELLEYWYKGEMKNES